MAAMSVRPFTAEDFAARMQRAAEQADEAGLTGVLVTPGPDLVYLTGYAPIAITERLTLLVLVRRRRDPAMVPDARAPRRRDGAGAGTLALTRLDRRQRPLRGRGAAAATRTAATRSPTRRGRCTCSGSSRRCPAPATSP